MPCSEKCYCLLLLLIAIASWLVGVVGWRRAMLGGWWTGGVKNGVAACHAQKNAIYGEHDRHGFGRSPERISMENTIGMVSVAQCMALSGRNARTLCA